MFEFVLFLAILIPVVLGIYALSFTKFGKKISVYFTPKRTLLILFALSILSFIILFLRHRGILGPVLPELLTLAVLSLVLLVAILSMYFSLKRVALVLFILAVVLVIPAFFVHAEAAGVFILPAFFLTSISVVLFLIDFIKKHIK